MEAEFKKYIEKQTDCGEMEYTDWLIGNCYDLICGFTREQLQLHSVSNRRELLRDKEVKCFDDFLELYCEKKDNGKWLYRVKS